MCGRGRLRGVAAGGLCRWLCPPRLCPRLRHRLHLRPRPNSSISRHRGGFQDPTARPAENWRSSGCNAVRHPASAGTAPRQRGHGTTGTGAAAPPRHWRRRLSAAGEPPRRARTPPIHGAGVGVKASVACPAGNWRSSGCNTDAARRHGGTVARRHGDATASCQCGQIAAPATPKPAGCAGSASSGAPELLHLAPPQRVSGPPRPLRPRIGGVRAATGPRHGTAAARRRLSTARVAARRRGQRGAGRGAPRGPARRR